MIITFYGLEFIKAQTGDVIVAFDPIGKDSSFKNSRFGSDLALVSLSDKDFNGVDQLTYKEKAPFVVSGPGEYEVKEIFVKGYGTNSKYGGKDHINTIYSVKFDEINFCHLGALSSIDQVTSEIIEGLGDIDILFVPIGGGDVLEAAEAYKIATKLAPRIIIPIHYDETAKKQLDAFLKNAGADGLAPVDKLTIKKKDILEKEGEIVLLKSQS
jgi:L-ascorbate metabolism protein UlaG (beta-lactamase superfamily)